MELIKVLIPIITFVAGFWLNEIIARRRRSNDLLKSSVAKALAFLHDWRSVLDELLFVCLTSDSDELLVDAFRRYRSKRADATMIDYEVAILRQYQRAAPFVTVLHEFFIFQKPDYVDRTVDEWSTFETVDALIKHEMSAAFVVLAPRISAEKEGVARVEGEINKDALRRQITNQLHDFHNAFGRAMTNASREAAAVLKSLS